MAVNLNMLQGLPPLLPLHVCALMQQLPHNLRLAVAHGMVQRCTPLGIPDQGIRSLLQQVGSTIVVPAHQQEK